MRELNEAFEVLGDPTRRKAYDRNRMFGGRPTSSPRPMPSQEWLKSVVTYIGLGILVVMSLRILPLLLRPQVLIAVAIGVFVYLLLRRFRRH